MKWRLVISLDLLFGLLLGAARLWYWPGWLIGPVAIAAMAVSPVMLARARGKVLASGLCTGLLIGLFQVGLVLALWDKHTASLQYEMRYDPSLRLQLALAEMLRSEVLSIAPLATIWGLVIGLLSWACGWLFGRFTKPKPADSTGS